MNKIIFIKYLLTIILRDCEYIVVPSSLEMGMYNINVDKPHNLSFMLTKSEIEDLETMCKGNSMFDQCVRNLIKRCHEC